MPVTEQLRNFLIATHQSRKSRSAVDGLEATCRPEDGMHTPCSYRRDDSLERAYAQTCKLKGVPHQPPRRWPNHNLVGSCQRLEPSGQVRRFTHCQPVLAAAV